jgi:CheY-like chemotaxis protein
VHLPPELAGERPESTPLERIDTVPSGSSRRRNRTVLIIDDEELARYLIRKQLSDLHIDIMEARSGPEGLRCAVDHRPDIVILDLVMPEMSGMEVLERLKANAATREIPVVVHTSRGVSMPELERISATAIAIIGKGPEGAGDLRRRVAELMHLTEA